MSPIENFHFLSNKNDGILTGHDVLTPLRMEAQIALTDARADCAGNVNHKRASQCFESVYGPRSCAITHDLGLYVFSTDARADCAGNVDHKRASQCFESVYSPRSCAITRDLGLYAFSTPFTESIFIDSVLIRKVKSTELDNMASSLHCSLVCDFHRACPGPVQMSDVDDAA